MGTIGLSLTLLICTLLSVVIWLGLLGLRGQFWRCDQRLPELLPALTQFPTVHVVIPARNEAEMLPVTLPSLLQQDYPGEVSVILVDDQSTDGTGTIARSVAESLGQQGQLTISVTEPLPPGWTGKLWAMEQGIRQSTSMDSSPDYWLLTDADIEHDRQNLRQLVAQAEQQQLDLVSLMVQLRCQSLWEMLLIPAFVFFFQKLYPFRWVNDPRCSVAAAAGGCILIRREALTRIGGIQTLKQALIDDCTLAKAVKSSGSNQAGIWLGLSTTTRSLRPYPSLASIWDMVARTAFTQLNYSPLLLLGTLLGMTLIYLVAPIGAIVGSLTNNLPLALAGITGWLLMAVAYLPTVRLYGCNPFLAFCLPFIAFLYTLMTLDSALRHWQGRGGAWKGRVYPGVNEASSTTERSRVRSC